jgi:hypothetical protein
MRSLCHLHNSPVPVDGTRATSTVQSYIESARCKKKRVRSDAYSIKMTKDDEQQNNAEREAMDNFSKEVVVALNNLPILTRLEFAKNLLDAKGGHKDAIDPNHQLIVVSDVLSEVIRVLEKHPSAAGLRTTDLKLG